MQHFCHFLCKWYSVNWILRALLHFSHNFSSCSKTLENCKTFRWHFWQIICDTPIIFCCITSDNRTDDNVFKNSWLFFPKTLILDRLLVLKSILQILQKSLGTMLVSFSGVFIPGLLLGKHCCKLPGKFRAWPQLTLSTRSSDILSLFTTRVKMDCWYNINFPGSTPAHMSAKLLYLVTFVIGSLTHLTAVICMKVRVEAKAKTRGFFSSSSPLQNSLSLLHGSLSLSPRKISRKPLGSGYELR